MSSITKESILEVFERCGSENAGKLFAEGGGLEPYIQAFETDIETGLSQIEKDNNFEDRRNKWGVNILPDPPKESWCHMFI